LNIFLIFEYILLISMLPAASSTPPSSTPLISTGIYTRRPHRQRTITASRHRVTSPRHVTASRHRVTSPRHVTASRHRTTPFYTLYDQGDGDLPSDDPPPPHPETPVESTFGDLSETSGDDLLADDPPLPPSKKRRTLKKHQKHGVIGPFQNQHHDVALGSFFFSKEARLAPTPRRSN